MLLSDTKTRATNHAKIFIYIYIYIYIYILYIYITKKYNNYVKKKESQKKTKTISYMGVDKTTNI